jgi:hypothetical protein
MPKPALTPALATIHAGESLSAPVDLRVGNVVLIISPAEWTDAEISVQVSIDGTAFFDLFDSGGYELTRTIVPSGAQPVAPDLTEAAMYLKIRSGSRTAPVEQEADRTFTLMLA